MIRTLSSYTAIALVNALGYTELEQQKRTTEQRNREIMAAQQQLIQSEKMASLGMLTTGVAHEINDPANFTHTATYMMQDEISKIKQYLKQLAGGEQAEPQLLQSFDDKFAKLSELAQTAQLGSKRIKGIVDSIRSFGHRDQQDRQEQLFGEIVKSTMQLIKTQYSAIEINIAQSILMTNRTFADKLGQVIMNLTVNACQAIEHKQKVQPQHKGQIDLNCHESDSKFTIEVQDNGCGMDEQTREKLFDAFYTTCKDGNGTGLGMSICHDIVKELDGDIFVSSSSNKGSVLTISLSIKQ
jgi:signal transduction histidine kinase